MKKELTEILTKLRYCAFYQNEKEVNADLDRALALADSIPERDN